MKTQILFLAANPTTETWLALDEEWRAIEAKLRAAERRESIELVTKWAVRPSDLLQYFHEHKPHIVHFSGHGTKSGEIVLVGKRRESKTVSSAALKNLFSVMHNNIRVVFLNACYSKIQAKAITTVVDCCIGMSDAVPDEAAIVFAAAFYQAIGYGSSVQAAFDCAKLAIRLEDIPANHIPKLLSRKGVDPNKMFLVNEQESKTLALSVDTLIPSADSRSIPRMVAKFKIADGRICFATGGKYPEIEMEIWIEGASPDTTTVLFEILDEDVRDRKWKMHRQKKTQAIREFLTDEDFHLYGDVEIWARGERENGEDWVIQTTLYEALCRYYDTREITKNVRRALRQIKTN